MQMDGAFDVIAVIIDQLAVLNALALQVKMSLTHSSRTVARMRNEVNNECHVAKIYKAANH